MTLIKFTAGACFVFAALAFLLAIVAEFPPILGAIPALLLVGILLLAINRVIELLTEIRAEVIQAGSDLRSAK